MQMLDRFPVESPCDLGGFLSQGSDDFRRIVGLVVLVARIDPLGTEAEPEIRTFLHAGFPLDYGLHEILGRRRIRGALQGHEGRAFFMLRPMSTQEASM